uniref:Plant/T31B5-30 protein n=1 Tax=Angiostrongylus cantonensis TaxID=6313 RepID=A0A0K0DIG0_ANGCA
MCDYNAWDMFGEPPESSTALRSAQSDSQFNKKFFTQLVKIHDSELQALGLDKEKIAEEAERQRADRMRRSKSPALETIRKASIHVLQKFGALHKKKDNTLLLYKEREVETMPLMEFCVSAYLFRGASYDQIEDGAASEVARLPEYDPFCPVHGSRRRIARRQHLVSMQHIMSSMDHDDAPEDVGYLYNYEFLAKIIRKKKREQLSGSEKLKVGKVIQKIKANLLIISVAFLFLFSAFNGLSNLQTSVNHELGADSLA